MFLGSEKQLTSFFYTVLGFSDKGLSGKKKCIMKKKSIIRHFVFALERILNTMLKARVGRAICKLRLIIANIDN